MKQGDPTKLALAFAIFLLAVGTADQLRDVHRAVWKAVYWSKRAALACEERR